MSTELLLYTTRRLNQFRIRELTMENHVLAIPESGVITFNDGSGDTEANALEGVFFEKGKFYKRSAVTPFYIHYFRFASDDTIFSEHHIKFKDTERIKSTLAMLNNLNGNAGFTDEFSIKRHLFMDIINQYIIENKINTQNTLRKDDKIEKAIDYMKKNLHIAASLTQLSDGINMSYCHFIRRFKAYTGVTPSQYLINLRLDRAQQLLSETDLQIKEIAGLCGFENEYYFSNFFKDNLNIRPSKYRKDI